MQPQYTNRHGRIITVSPTHHAVCRFIERVFAVENRRIQYDTALERIRVLFNASRRKQNMNQHYKNRMRKHGAHTLYFHNGNYRFVVENRKIVTIEIRGKLRHLN